MRRDANLEPVIAYWHALRGCARLPDRAQIDPRALGEALDGLAIAEEIAPGLGRFRLAGQRYAALMGMEVRGMPVSALFLPEDRILLVEAMARVFAHDAMAEATLIAQPGMGQPGLSGQMLVLPLADGLRGRRLAMLALSMPGPAGRTPRRIGLSGIALSPLSGALPRERHAATAPTTALAEAAAPWRPARLNPDPRPELRVVDGGLSRR